MEARDVKREGKGGAAEFRPVTPALCFRNEGQTQRHAMVAVMDPQTAQTHELSAGAVGGRPAAEPQRRPFRLVVGDQHVALGPRQHAMLEKIHDPRIGVEYRQSIRVRHGDGPQVEPFSDDVMAVQDGSLPVAVAGL